ncbi:uncharacterized protein LOC127606352 [Hippocampus zosterae]|uniref:uncharacterized protein LOC127606352 n=1 Tax=Hippocampus zosterae TaxID=109293 RepID=UPI00223DC3AE|nr:uncharacterized protein LOC127606352 [Hippocampus zosterae]XP_051930604.1 uncharacterized protein LOC127606352 [Hippocampus zosterae]
MVKGPRLPDQREEVIPEIGRQAPMNADDEIGNPAPMNEMLSEAATDLKAKIMARIKAGQPRNRLQRLCEVPPESLMESVNAALRAIPTVTITETNELIYASASVILEMLGYKSNHGSHEIRDPPWKRWLEAKIKAARKDVSQLTEAQRGVMKRPIPERYIQITIPKRGKVVHTKGVSLPEGTIADIENSYKYLGIPQANGNLELATRKAAMAKYLLQVRQVLRSQLNGKNKTRAINSYALPVIIYPAGIIRRPNEEIQTTDVKTRKRRTMHGRIHPKSSTLRLYAIRKEGGRGLASVRATVQDETSKLHEYIKEKAPTDDVLIEGLR